MNYCVFSYFIVILQPFLFGQNADLRIGFQKTQYTVFESDGILEITVGPAVDDDPVDIGIPLGLRITSRDGSALGNEVYKDSVNVFSYAQLVLTMKVC